jgi:hypothetical protein
VYAIVRNDRVVRVGRTDDLQRRREDYRRDPQFRGMQFRELAQTDVYAEQRGLEQRAIDRYGARRDTGRPAYNKIEGISSRNPNLEIYRSAADSFPNLENF